MSNTLNEDAIIGCLLGYWAWAGLSAVQAIDTGKALELVEFFAKVFLLFEQDQPLRCVLVGQALTMLVVGVSTLSQCPVVDVAATSEGVRQDALLFITWIEAILVGFLLVHTLQ